MSAGVKFLIGLVAVLLMGWIHHGPLGNGAALVAGLEDQARAAIVESEVAGVEVRLGREPLSRAATLSGPANDFQREGMGQFPGINDRVGAIDGITSIDWADQPGGNRIVPLLLETLGLLLLAYLAGVLLAWLLFGRTKRDTYL